MLNFDSKNATPEQLLLFKHASSLIAWNTIEPLVYQGLIAGSEFLTYSADKLYICLTGLLSAINPGLLAYAGIMDESNAQCAQLNNQIYYYTGTAVDQCNKPIELNNLYFSNFIVTNLDYIQFIGYRLTIV